MAVWHTDVFFKRYGHLDDQTAAASHIRYEMHPITHLIARLESAHQALP